MDLQLTDKRVLVTGSSAGIGKAIARTLAAEGAAVVITGRDGRKAEMVAEEIRAQSGMDRFRTQTQYLETFRAEVRELSGGRPSLSAKEVDELEMRMVCFLGHDRMARWIQEGANPVAQEINGSASIVR